MNNFERRYVKQELRVSDDAKPVISGYAAVFDSQSVDLGGGFGEFRETVDPHAFDSVMASNPDVRALWNHDSNHPLGRTRAGTLRLKVDARGLSYEIDPPDTQTARDLLVSMRRGDVTGSSFGFTVKRDQWTDEDGGAVSRKILEFDELFDVSPVTFPAYPAAASQVSSLLGSMPAETRARILTKRSAQDSDGGDEEECICGCSQCMGGDCGSRSNPDYDDVNCRCSPGRALAAEDGGDKEADSDRAWRKQASEQVSTALGRIAGAETETRCLGLGDVWDPKSGLCAPKHKCPECDQRRVSARSARTFSREEIVPIFAVPPTTVQ
jgi:HK97 family phage prohead protease